MQDSEDNAYDTVTLQRPVFANGTAIKKGAYRFFMRALRATGNRNKETDYDTWLSPPFIVA